MTLVVVVSLAIRPLAREGQGSRPVWMIKTHSHSLASWFERSTSLYVAIARLYISYMRGWAYICRCIFFFWEETFFFSLWHSLHMLYSTVYTIQKLSIALSIWPLSFLLWFVYFSSLFHAVILSKIFLIANKTHQNCTKLHKEKKIKRGSKDNQPDGMESMFEKCFCCICYFWHGKPDGEHLLLVTLIAWSTVPLNLIQQIYHGDGEARVFITSVKTMKNSTKLFLPYIDGRGL